MGLLEREVKKFGSLVVLDDLEQTLSNEERSRVRKSLLEYSEIWPINRLSIKSTKFHRESLLSIICPS